MRNSLFILLAFFFVACGKSPQGVAHKAVDEVYPFMGFSRKIYSESMVRAALGVANIDSTAELSRHIEYLMQFEVKRSDRWFNADSDSIIMARLTAANAELFVEYDLPKARTAVYIIGEGDVVNDLIYIQSDTASYTIYEFVGDMPMHLLVKSAMNNYEQISEALNLDILGNGRRDSTNN